MSNGRDHRLMPWIILAGGAAALCVLIGLVAVLWFLRGGAPRPMPPLPAASESTPAPPPPALPPQPVPFGERITTDTHNWGDVPFGDVVCQDVQFTCQGAIRLNGLRAAREGKRYPGAVLGVPVQRRGSRIHLLHAAENWPGMTPGAPYGRVTLHYTNGATHSFYLLFSVHGLDWYGGARTPEEAVTDPNTRLGWYFKRKDGTYRRFFHTMFANPLPDVEIASADFVSPLGSANLWVFGFTLSEDPAPLEPEVSEADLAPQRVFVTLRLQDAAGKPIAGGSVAWQVRGTKFQVEFPPFRADAEGRVVLDLPRELPAEVSFTASAPDGTAATGSLEKDATGQFPVEQVVKLIRSEGR
jgi:hypothetical protein